ncbi:hypothetical protein ZWY2020_035458 [Hordeum vulgare]|nr:hypothetical protein ZWY2020_035458 [Hordeum vulgare]
METDLQRRPEAVTAEEEYHPPETYLECFHQKQRPQPSFNGWRATTWSMLIPILSWEDWSPGCTIDADETILEQMHYKLLPWTSGSISDIEPTQHARPSPPFPPSLLSLLPPISFSSGAISHQHPKVLYICS